jgi:hypothetical protein
MGIIITTTTDVAAQPMSSLRGERAVTAALAARACADFFCCQTTGISHFFLRVTLPGNRFPLFEITRTAPPPVFIGGRRVRPYSSSLAK